MPVKLIYLLNTIFYPLEVVCILIILGFNRLIPKRSFFYLHIFLIYLINFTWLPIPFLDHLLILIAEQDREAGLREIKHITYSSRQSRAAKIALLELATRNLKSISSLPQMAGVKEALAWLPDDPKALPEGAHEALQRMKEIGQSVRAALESTSRYRQVLGLEKARAELDDLSKSLAFAHGSVAIRFRPIVEKWRGILDAELARLAKEAEREEIPQVYIAGPPLPEDSGGLFVGREDLFRELEGVLATPYRKPTLMLYGQRRTGKTSFLLQLPHRLGPDVVPVFINMQRAANVESASGLLYNLARAIAERAERTRGLRLNSLDLDKLETEPYIRFDEWLSEVEKALGDRLVLLCFDEFEKIEEKMERIGPDFLDFLRDFIEHRTRFIVLFSGSHTLEELGREWSTYFINVQTLNVSYLREADARQLITNPIDDFPLNYEEAAVERIIAVTRCQPFFVQLTCQELVNYLNAEHRLFARVDDVEVAFERALERGEFHFTELWKTTADLEREILTTVARGDGPLALRRLQKATKAKASELSEALERLCRHDFLERADGGYRFQVELMRRWWEKRR